MGIMIDLVLLATMQPVSYHNRSSFPWTKYLSWLMIVIDTSSGMWTDMNEFMICFIIQALLSAVVSPLVRGKLD